MRSPAALALLFTSAVCSARPTGYGSPPHYGGPALPQGYQPQAGGYALPPGLPQGYQPPAVGYALPPGFPGLEGYGLTPPAGSYIPPTIPPTGSYDVPQPPPPPAESEVPPTETEVPPTPTEVPPTETEVPPTVTPPTETEVPPTETEVPPTETAPTETEVPPTETEVPPTETEVPPTETEVPPTTETEVPPTETEVPPTETEVPPSEAPYGSEVPPSEYGSEAPPSDAPYGSEVAPSEAPYESEVSPTQTEESYGSKGSKGPNRLPKQAYAIECQVSDSGFEPKEMSVKKGDTVTFKFSGGSKYGIRKGGDSSSCVPLPTGATAGELTYTVPQDASDKIYFYNVIGDQCTEADMSATLNVENNLVSDAIVTNGTSTAGGDSTSAKVSNAASNLPTVALVGAISFIATLVQL